MHASFMLETAMETYVYRSDVMAHNIPTWFMLCVIAVVSCFKGIGYNQLAGISFQKPTTMLSAEVARTSTKEEIITRHLKEANNKETKYVCLN